MFWWTQNMCIRVITQICLVLLSVNSIYVFLNLSKCYWSVVMVINDVWSVACVHGKRYCYGYIVSMWRFSWDWTEKAAAIFSLKLHLGKYFSPGSLRPRGSPSRQSLCNRLELNKGEHDVCLWHCSGTLIRSASLNWKTQIIPLSSVVKEM